MKRRKLHSGDKITSNGCNGTFRFVCCACGLSHDISFSVADGKLTLLIATNIRSTSQFRRHLKPSKETLEAIIGNYAKEKTEALPKKHEIVQLLNPRSHRYVKVDKTVGGIIAHKKTPNPYKGIPIVSKES